MGLRPCNVAARVQLSSRLSKFVNVGLILHSSFQAISVRQEGATRSTVQLPGGIQAKTRQKSGKPGKPGFLGFLFELICAVLLMSCTDGERHLLQQIVSARR